MYHIYKPYKCWYSLLCFACQTKLVKTQPLFLNSCKWRVFYLLNSTCCCQICRFPVLLQRVEEKEKEQDFYYETSEWGHGKWVSLLHFLTASHSLFVTTVSQLKHDLRSAREDHCTILSYVCFHFSFSMKLEL